MRLSEVIIIMTILDHIIHVIIYSRVAVFCVFVCAVAEVKSSAFMPL